MKKMSVEVVVHHTCQNIGEGPLWEKKTQTLLYVDVYSGDAHRFDPATGEDTKLHFDKTISFIIPRKSGGYALGHGQNIILTKSWSNSDYEVVAEMDEGLETKVNDAKCDETGRLWTGTMPFEKIPGKTDGITPEISSLYSFSVDRKLTHHLDKLTICNGMAWSQDNRIMYFIDSMPRKVYAFDYAMDKGAIANQRVAIDFGGDDTLADTGYPDGMCIDENDNIWVACYAASKVICFNPTTGDRLKEINIPGAQNITSCCFGGKNYDEMYVTCSRNGLSNDVVKNEQPNAGSVFRVIGLGVKGFPACEYGG